jgi:predicted nucleotidyltransferase
MKSEYFSKDIQDLLSSFSEHGVKYLIVGGEAVIYHGYPRFTGDIDVFYERTPENADRLWKALNAFWVNGVPGMQGPSELLEEGTIVQFGVPPNRMDFINSIDGVSFQQAWKNRITEDVAASRKKFKIHYIGLDDLIRNKKAVSRNKDLDDLRYLERMKKFKNT